MVHIFSKICQLNNVSLLQLLMHHREKDIFTYPFVIWRNLSRTTYTRLRGKAINYVLPSIQRFR